MVYVLVTYSLDAWLRGGVRWMYAAQTRTKLRAPILKAGNTGSIRPCYQVLGIFPSAKSVFFLVCLPKYHALWRQPALTDRRYTRRGVSTAASGTR